MTTNVTLRLDANLLREVRAVAAEGAPAWAIAVGAEDGSATGGEMPPRSGLW